MINGNAARNFNLQKSVPIIPIATNHPSSPPLTTNNSNHPPVTTNQCEPTADPDVAAGAPHQGDSLFKLSSSPGGAKGLGLRGFSGANIGVNDC